MRIHIDVAPMESLEYLRTAVAVMKNNKEVSDNIKAYQTLKELTLSLGKRVDELEAERRNKVCR